MEIAVVAGGKYDGSLVYLNPTSIPVEVVLDFFKTIKTATVKVGMDFLGALF